MKRIILLIALGLVAASCGGASSSTFESLEDGSSNTLAPLVTSTTTGAPSAAAPAALPDSDYPDVVVADLAGGDVNLRELVLESKPVLLWFWAPH